MSLVQDNNTPNRQYPEPFGQNDLATDVARLIAAFGKIDADVAALIIAVAQAAGLVSPAFLGTPTAPTPDQGDQSSKLATTAFVALALSQINLSGVAPLDSPAFVGTPTAPTASNADASAKIATTGFVANVLSVLTGSPPSTLNTLQKLAAAINNNPNYATSVAAYLNDPWSMFPIWVPIPVYNNLPGTPPPTDKFYRYVVLSAADAYNSGVLGSESVSGSAPLISATGVITLANSPLLGQTVRLINTERRFIRPGAPGTLEENQNQSHNHPLSDPGHGHGVNDPTHSHLTIGGSGNNPGAGAASLNVGNNMNANTSASATGISIAAHVTGIALSAQGGNEARPRSIGMNYYMRIR